MGKFIDCQTIACLHPPCASIADRLSVKRARPIPIVAPMPSDNATTLIALAQPRDVVGGVLGLSPDHAWSAHQMAFGARAGTSNGVWRAQHVRVSLNV